MAERLTPEQPFVKRYDIDLSGLTDSERAIFNPLARATEKLAGVYSQQRNLSLPSGSLYPPDATVEELEEANILNPEILSPYTVVQRDDVG